MSRHVLARRCWNHGERFAVVRCPECGRHFCRECVAEHDGRMTCGACLQVAGNVAIGSREWSRRSRHLGQVLLALFLMWVFFHSAGWVLLQIPTPMHEGTLWRTEWWEEEP